jgi:hypothetical protein
MDQKYKPSDATAATLVADPGLPGGDALVDHARRLWAESSALIDRVLSGDSETFNRANRQPGAQ